MDLSVVGVRRISGDTLRGDGSRAARKRVGKSKHRLSVLNRVEEALGDLKGPIRQVPGEAAQSLGENAIAAAEYRFLAEWPVSETDPGIEIVQRRRFLSLPGHHFDRARGVE